MDNGGMSLGGGAPAEDGDAGAGVGAPAENVREGAREAAGEGGKEAAVARIEEGAKKIRAVRVVEGKAGKKRGEVAVKLRKVLSDTPIAGDLLMTVVQRATAVDQKIRAAARVELDQVDPLPLKALEFLGLPVQGDTASTNNATPPDEEDDADEAPGQNLLAA